MQFYVCQSSYQLTGETLSFTIISSGLINSRHVTYVDFYNFGINYSYKTPHILCSFLFKCRSCCLYMTGHLHLGGKSLGLQGTRCNSNICYLITILASFFLKPIDFWSHWESINWYEVNWWRDTVSWVHTDGNLYWCGNTLL